MLFKVICDLCGEQAVVLRLNGQLDSESSNRSEGEPRAPHHYEIDCPKCGVRHQAAKLQTRPSCQ